MAIQLNLVIIMYKAKEAQSLEIIWDWTKSDLERELEVSELVRNKAYDALVEIIKTPSLQTQIIRKDKILRYTTPNIKLIAISGLKVKPTKIKDALLGIIDNFRNIPSGSITLVESAQQTIMLIKESGELQFFSKIIQDPSLDITIRQLYVEALVADKKYNYILPIFQSPTRLRKPALKELVKTKDGLDFLVQLPDHLKLDENDENDQSYNNKKDAMIEVLDELIELNDFEILVKIVKNAQAGYEIREKAAIALVGTTCFSAGSLWDKLKKNVESRDYSNDQRLQDLKLLIVVGARNQLRDITIDKDLIIGALKFLMEENLTLIPDSGTDAHNYVRNVRARLFLKLVSCYRKGKLEGSFAPDQNTVLDMIGGFEDSGSTSEFIERASKIKVLDTLAVKEEILFSLCLLLGQDFRLESLAINGPSIKGHIPSVYQGKSLEVLRGWGCKNRLINIAKDSKGDISIKREAVELLKKMSSYDSLETIAMSEATPKEIIIYALTTLKGLDKLDPRFLRENKGHLTQYLKSEYQALHKPSSPRTLLPLTPPSRPSTDHERPAVNPEEVGNSAMRAPEVDEVKTSEFASEMLRAAYNALYVYEYITAKDWGVAKEISMSIVSREIFSYALSYSLLPVSVVQAWIILPKDYKEDLACKLFYALDDYLTVPVSCLDCKEITIENGLLQSLYSFGIFTGVSALNYVAFQAIAKVPGLAAVGSHAAIFNDAVKVVAFAHVAVDSLLLPEYYDAGLSGVDSES